MLPLKSDSGLYTLAVLSLLILPVCIVHANNTDHSGIPRAAHAYCSVDTTNGYGGARDVGIDEPAPVHTLQVDRISAPLGLAHNWWQGAAVRARRLSNGLRSLVSRGPIELGASENNRALSHLRPEATTTSLPLNMVYVRLSRAFLCQYCGPAMHQRAPITDEILGTAVRGTSTTATLTRFTLTPDDNLGRCQLRIVGTTDFDVLGTRRWVRIGARGMTEFKAEKTVLLDGNALRPTPTLVHARTRITGTRSSSRLQGLSGHIIRIAAARRLARTRSQAECVTSRLTEQRIAQQIDQWVSREVADFTKPLGELAKTLPEGSPLMPREVRCNSSREVIEFVILGAADDERRMVDAPARHAAPPDVAVHIHRTVIGQVLADPKLRPVAKAVAESLLSLAGSSTIAAKATSSPCVPTSNLQWSEDRQWITLTWSSGRQSNTDFERRGR
jgi:hypothetical protein